MRREWPTASLSTPGVLVSNLSIQGSSLRQPFDKNKSLSGKPRKHHDGQRYWQQRHRY